MYVISLRVLYMDAYRISATCRHRSLNSASLSDAHCTLVSSSSKVYVFVPLGELAHHGVLTKVVKRTYTCVLRTEATIVADDEDDVHDPMDRH